MGQSNAPLLASNTLTTGACVCVCARAAAADTLAFAGGSCVWLGPPMLPETLNASGPLMREQEERPTL